MRKIQGGKCAVKVMSRISTHNTRCTSRATPSSGEMLLLLSLIQHKQPTKSLEMTFFSPPPRRSSVLKTSVFLSEDADKAFLRYGEDTKLVLVSGDRQHCADSLKWVSGLGFGVLRPELLH